MVFDRCDRMWVRNTMKVEKVHEVCLEIVYTRRVR